MLMYPLSLKISTMIKSIVVLIHNILPTLQADLTKSLRGTFLCTLNDSFSYFKRRFPVRQFGKIQDFR